MPADVIEYKIIGDDLQAVEIALDPNEGVRAEIGAMIYMSNGVSMDTNTGGGLINSLKRIVVGESLFVSSFYNSGHEKGYVAFAAPYPGKIIPIDLNLHGRVFYCQKDAYLCSARGVDIEIAFTKKFGAGLFGGEGFILEKLVGDGFVFVHAGGTIIEKILVEGETLRVDTGCIIGFDDSVTYDIQFNAGITNLLFGEEGLFFATLKGPGKVFLQSLPFSRLADRIFASSKLAKQLSSKK